MRRMIVLLVLLVAAARAHGAIGIGKPASEPMAPGPGSGNGALIASNGHGFLVMWQGAAGSRMTADGEAIDLQPLAIRDMDYVTSVASDGADYLVAGWPRVLYGSRISVSFVSAAHGSVEQTYSAAGTAPLLVGRRSSYVLSYLDDTYKQLVFVNLDRRGRPQGPVSRVPVETYAFPAMVANGDDVGVFWIDYSKVPHAAALTRSDDGSWSLPAGSMSTGAVRPLSVAASGDRYLVAYESEGIVWAQLFGRDLQPQGPPIKAGRSVLYFPAAKVTASRNGFLLFLNTGGDELVMRIDGSTPTPRPFLSGAGIDDVVSDGDRLVVVYTALRGVIRSLVTSVSEPRAFANGDGAAQSFAPRITLGGALASYAGGFAVGWNGWSGGDSAVYVRRFDAAGEPLGPQFVIGSGRLSQIASDGAGGYLCTWMREVPYKADQYAPAFAVIGPDGTVVEGRRFDSAGWMVASPAVVWTGDHYVMAWRSQTTPKRNVVAVRIAANGELPDAAPVDITEGSHESNGLYFEDGEPVLASSGRGVYFAIPTTIHDAAWRSNATQIYGTLYSSDLAQLQPLARVGDGKYPGLVFDGRRFVVTFSNGAGIRAVRMTPEGVPLDDALGVVVRLPRDAVALGPIGDRIALSYGIVLYRCEIDTAVCLRELSANGIVALAPANAPGEYWYAGRCYPPDVGVCVGLVSSGNSREQPHVAH